MNFVVKINISNILDPLKLTGTSKLQSQSNIQSFNCLSPLSGIKKKQRFGLNLDKKINVNFTTFFKGGNWLLIRIDKVAE
jgi:hypothetical protein